MRFIILLSLFVLTGCATKYIIPGNRFITPESQGGALRGQFEFQQTKGNQLTINTDNATVDEGVKYNTINRSGFLFSNSFFESFDLIWSHTGSANSMLGGKFQLVGASRSGNGAGHKVAVAALFGGNEHETDDKSVDFELTGKEFLLLYGYRISENLLPYASFSYSTYDFSGRISSSDPMLNGLEPEFKTRVMGVNGGIEFSWEAFFAKVEGSYQQLETKDTKNKTNLILGYSLGYSW